MSQQPYDVLLTFVVEDIVYPLEPGFQLLGANIGNGGIGLCSFFQVNDSISKVRSLYDLSPDSSQPQTKILYQTFRTRVDSEFQSLQYIEYNKALRIQRPSQFPNVDLNDLIDTDLLMQALQSLDSTFTKTYAFVKVGYGIKYQIGLTISSGPDSDKGDIKEIYEQIIIDDSERVLQEMFQEDFIKNRRFLVPITNRASNNKGNLIDFSDQETVQNINSSNYTYQYDDNQTNNIINDSQNNTNNIIQDLQIIPTNIADEIHKIMQFVRAEDNGRDDLQLVKNLDRNSIAQIEKTIKIMAKGNTAVEQTLRDAAKKELLKHNAVQHETNKSFFDTIKDYFFWGGATMHFDNANDLNRSRLDNLAPAQDKFSKISKVTIDVAHERLKNARLKNIKLGEVDIDNIKELVTGDEASKNEVQRLYAIMLSIPDLQDYIFDVHEDATYRTQDMISNILDKIGPLTYAGEVLLMTAAAHYLKNGVSTIISHVPFLGTEVYRQGVPGIQQLISALGLIQQLDIEPREIEVA